MELDGGDCPEVVDTLFDAFGEGEGFSLAGDDQHCEREDWRAVVVRWCTNGSQRSDGLR